MKNIFTYGTLMCEDIMYEVAGCHPAHETGIVKGYCRQSVRGESYPAIMPDNKASVDGVVYLDVPESAWNRLDRFEGEMYDRVHVVVELNDGTHVSADTYVIKPEYLNCLEQSEWDFDCFIRNGKEKFQRQYKGYHEL